jgi:hypothetical protein
MKLEHHAALVFEDIIEPAPQEKMRLPRSLAGVVLVDEEGAAEERARISAVDP